MPLGHLIERTRGVFVLYRQADRAVQQLINGAGANRQCLRNDTGMRDVYTDTQKGQKDMILTRATTRAARVLDSSASIF